MIYSLLHVFFQGQFLCPTPVLKPKCLLWNHTSALLSSEMMLQDLDAGVGNWSCASPLATTFFLGISVHLNGHLYTRWELGWKRPHFYSVPKDKVFRVGESLMLLPADKLTEPNQTFQAGLHTEAVLRTTEQLLRYACLLLFPPLFFTPSVFQYSCCVRVFNLKWFIAAKL